MHLCVAFHKVEIVYQNQTKTSLRDTSKFPTTWNGQQNMGRIVFVLLINPKKKNKYLFVASVSTNSAVFVATLPVNPSIIYDIV